MRRGEIYDARLDPTEGSEQAGYRPVVIVSRDTINAGGTMVIIAPCTTYRRGRRIYPSQTLVQAPDGGLVVDSVVKGEQVRALARHRLGRRRGVLSPEVLARIDRALLIALDLPGQF